MKGLFAEIEVQKYNDRNLIESLVFDEINSMEESGFKNTTEILVSNLFLKLSSGELKDAEVFYLRKELDRLVGFTYFDFLKYPEIRVDHEGYALEFHDESFYVPPVKDAYSEYFEEIYLDERSLFDDIKSLILVDADSEEVDDHLYYDTDMFSGFAETMIKLYQGDI